MEQLIMNIIMTAGDAKSLCMEALQNAREKCFDEAHKLLEEANERILDIHRLQTTLMQRECSGEKIEYSVLLVHSQDHLTNAMITYDLANEFIAFMEETNNRFVNIKEGK